MKPAELSLSHEKLLEFLEYDPETGIFRWKKRPSNRVKIGDVAGNETWHGYWTIYFDGYNFLSHRLAWFYVHGTWPHELDHRDQNTLNNRLSNIREASSSQNKMNRKGRKDSECGLKGVYIHKRHPLQYRARITKSGETIHLGLFATAEEAHAAYVAASSEHHGEFGRTG